MCTSMCVDEVHAHTHTHTHTHRIEDVVCTDTPGHPYVTETPDVCKSNTSDSETVLSFSVYHETSAYPKMVLEIRSVQLLFDISETMSLTVLQELAEGCMV